MSGSFGFQEVDPDESADRRRGHGPLHDDPLLAHQRKPQHQDEGGGRNGSGLIFFNFFDSTGNEYYKFRKYRYKPCSPLSKNVILGGNQT